MKKLQQQTGQAMMVAILFFLVISVTMVFGLVGPVVRQQNIVSDFAVSRQSYFLAEAGMEDVVYRLKTGKSVSVAETIALGGATTTVTTTSSFESAEIVSDADVRSLKRRLKSDVVAGSGVAFYFGIQAGNGGLLLENYSSILGNVYSNGAVEGSGPGNNVIGGYAVSAGPVGLVNNLHATSSVYAHTISNALIDGDAHYQNISNTTVSGISYPNSSDQATATMPITDAQIEVWKQSALDGGTISSPCPYKITEAATIGPKKINCDLEINGNNFTVVLTGNLWVDGNITIKNAPNIKVDESFGNKGVAVVADDSSTPLSDGTITIENSATFEGSGQSGSHVMFISQNRSAESGGAIAAIDVKNSVSGDLLVYAGHGKIVLENNINLKEVTAFFINLKNSAQVTYETGLTSLIFDSGPSGGYEILSWREIE